MKPTKTTVMESKKLNTQSMVQMAACIALICVSSYLVIPLPFTPIVLSLHTIMVNLTGLLLKPKQAAITMGIYLLMGLIGLPVYSAGTSGPGKLFGPTGGFYFGFLIAVVVISLLKGSKPNIIRYAIITILLGVPIQHVCAILMMCVHNGFNVFAAVTTVSLPFIPGDVIKCVIASLLAVAIHRTLPKAFSEV